MDKEGWIVQLGRLYKEVEVESGQGAKEFASQFNRVLTNLQEEFPEEEFVQATGEVKLGGIYTGDRVNANQEIKLKCGQLADALGYDLPEPELNQTGDLTVITLQSDQTQTAEQTVSQEVSIENVMEMINYTTLNQQKKEELQGVVGDFEEELSKDDPNPSTLRDYIKSAKGYSVDVAAKLSMLALSNGVVGVLGF